MNKIIISESTFLPLKISDKGLIGVASVVFNNSLSLNCISVYLRPNGDLRLVFPIKVLPNGKELNVYYPINNETYEAIRQKIISKYKEITANITDF